MKQEDKKGKKNEIGAYGEQIAVTYLEKRGFTVIERNYLKKWGEIDIVSCETRGGKRIIHFIEVKTVSYETKSALQKAVLYGTWRPEENVHAKKIQRMNRAIETWLDENKSQSEWQIDVAAVRIVVSERYASIKLINNVVL